MGSCSEAFKAAKAHYNPKQASHDGTHNAKLYGGDLPNVYAAADGSVRADIIEQVVTFEDEPTSLFDGDGSSFIVHAKADPLR